MRPSAEIQNDRAQITFHSAGAAPNITLTSNVSFNAVFDASSNNTATIKPDAAMHAQILGQVKAESDRLDACRTPVIAMLKEYVELKGTSQGLNPAQKGYVDQFVLSRNAQNGTWMGQGQITDRSTGQTEIVPAMAGVGIMNGKPVVQVLTQKARV